MNDTAIILNSYSNKSSYNVYSSTKNIFIQHIEFSENLEMPPGYQ